MLKRILSLFLCLVMVLSILPAQTLATETESLELVVETEPVEETTAPTEAVTEPTEEVIVPTEAVTEPMEEATVPTEAVTEPTEEVAMPTEAVTESTEEVTAPTEEVADSRYWDSNLSNDNNITGYNTDDEQNDLYTYALDDNNYATITGYTGSDSVLVIPDTIDGYTVDAIGVKAFAGHSELVTVDIPDTVVVIEAAAFANCRSLTSVALSKNLTSMGAFAFYNCDALTSITIPKKLETTTQAYFAEYALGDVYGPFYGCDGLKTVTFEDGIREIANGLFANCWGLERVIIPNTVTTVEEKAFFHCENLKHLTLSTSLTTIEDRACAECTSLEAINIPDSVTEIGGGAFANCTSMQTAVLSKGLETIYAHAFYNCDALTSIAIPKKLETTADAYFAEYALGSVYGPFYGCDGLKTVSFEDGIREIANGLLANCPGLENVTIPDTVTTVEEKAFFHCENLKHLTLSTSLTTIEDRACAECTSLEAIVIPDTVTEIGGGAFANCRSMQTAVLSKGLETISAFAFYNCDALTSIEIPKKLKTTKDAYFAEYALGFVYGPFYDCDGLNTVSFEEGASVIPIGLFRCCTGLKQIQIPETIDAIESGAFEQSGLTEIVIPDTVTSVGEYILAGCPDLKTVVWTSGVSEIPKHTFAGSASVESVMIPDNVVCIKQAAFKDVGAMETIDLPESLTMIETEVFSNCDALTSIVIPDKVTTIGGNAFYDSDLLETVSIGSSVAEIGKECFFDCDALTTVTMGNSVTSIGTSVFEHCDMLKNVTLSRNLTVIPDAAFKYCAELEEITIPYYVTSIENEAFNSSPKLAKVIMPRGLTSIGTAAFSYANTTVIYGVPGTYAETWADENGFRFVAHEVTATGASLNKTTLTLHKGASEALILSVTPADSTDAITWKSSNTSVVTVTDMGVLKAVDNGTATIKVNVGGFTASCKVTVVQPVTSVSLRDPIVYLEALESFQLNATVRPNNADNQEIIWSSSDDRIVSVDENGLITGLTKGTVTITATAADGSGCSDSCTVTVNNSAYIALEPEQLESSHNYPNNCSDYWIYRKSGSETLYVLFDERTMLEDEFDYLRIYDASNELIGEYTGSALSGTTVTVPGDTVKIQIVSDESGNEWGFKVTSVYADEEYVENRVTVSPAVLEDVNSVWVDGAEYAIQKDNDYWYIDLPDGHAETMVAYTYNEGDSDDIHTQYPVSMKVWTLSNVDGYYAATRVEEFDDILQYSGASIRTAGKKGIRMITSMEQTKKNALTADVLAGYTLKEYGTVIAWAEQLGDQPLVLGASYAKSNYAYRKGVSDPVFNELDGLMQYTNVLVNFSDAQCSKDIAMRSYMILEDADGNEATLYGGIVTRSIGYIAYQNRNEFDPGTESYEYIWDIIHNVYGDIYDGEYEAK